jgi:signal transduction histidine kinase
MSAGARAYSRVTELAVGRHLPYRTVRRRLTLLYGGLFLLSGAALMAIAYALLVNAGFVFTLDSGATAQLAPRPPLVHGGLPASFPLPGSTTHPSAQTMAYWREVAQCMRQHGVPQFPFPRDSVPFNFAYVSEMSDRDGAILLIPAKINTQSSVFTQASNTCGYTAGSSKQFAAVNGRRTEVRQQLLVQSGIALAGMSLLSLGLGWLMAGRVLQPLEASYRAQRQFVANASHELRAPLARLRALSEVALASSAANVASLRAAHERVVAAEQQLEQLIDALLVLSRGQAGLERRERVEVATLIEQSMLARKPQLVALGLDLRATLDPAPAIGDPRLVERLIDNLIDNAIGHNRPDGYVEVTSGTGDRHAYLVIANSGPVISSEEIPRLFEAFERLSGARGKHGGGHGIGLSIVEAIADAHGAELTASARPEGGLTIKVSFLSASSASFRARYPLPRRNRERARHLPDIGAAAGD